jgi:TetR/AcrR family transcriptional regulator, fatty acid metabolism regulator protein
VAPRTSDDLKEVIRDFRRDQVIDVARRLFGERGTTEVSMDEIAAKAGVARSTVYVYFSNRDELLRACLKRMHDQLVAAIAEAWASSAAPMDRLQILLTGVFEQLDDSPAFLRLALSTQESASQDGVAVGSELALIGLNVAGLLSEIFADGVAAGLFRAMDSDLAITLVGQQIYGAMSVRAAEPLPRPRAEVAAEICDFVVRGLGT